MLTMEDSADQVVELHVGSGLSRNPVPARVLHVSDPSEEKVRELEGVTA
jgi:hypothetical protein